MYNYDSFSGLKNYESDLFVPEEIGHKEIAINTDFDLDNLIKKSIRDIGVNTHKDFVEEVSKKSTRNVGVNVHFENKEVVKEKVVLTETVYVPEKVPINSIKSMKSVSIDAQSFVFENYKKSYKDIGIDPVAQLTNDIKIQLSNKAIDTRDELIWEEEIEKAKQEGIPNTALTTQSLTISPIIKKSQAQETS